MGSKYKEAVGEWKHKIGKIEHIIEPEEDDNYKFLEIKKKAQTANSDMLLYKSLGDLYYDMVLRSNQAMDEEERKDLRKWISININQILDDFLIAFRWTTREKLDDLKKNVTSLEEKGTSLQGLKQEP